MKFVFRHLVDRGFLKEHSGTGKYQVTGNGFERIEAQNAFNAASAQAFVAMWFDASMDNAWSSGFAMAIKQAGFEPFRINLKEHNNKICDEIIAEIRRSRFLVADFTGHRGGVYYEAGFAAGLGLPVIFTCKRDHLQDLHFDVRQFNTIDWSDAADLTSRLGVRISATIGDGPRRSK